jgi:hypothetical protein
MSLAYGPLTVYCKIKVKNFLRHYRTYSHNLQEIDIKFPRASCYYAFLVSVIGERENKKVSTTFKFQINKLQNSP